MKDAYSYPEYCDIAYDWGRAGECDFIETCAAKFSSGKGRRILDIACGTGIHLREFARRGYETCGIDSSPEMAEYVKKRSAAEELAADCRVSDMKGFILPGKYSFAICMLDSFRYMLTDEDISIHLGAVSESLDKGGIYFIDLWMPVAGSPVEWEDVSWTQERGGTTVKARYVQHGKTFDPAVRTFEDELIFKVSGPREPRTLISRAITRLLEQDEFYGIVERQGSFEPVRRFYNFDFGSKGAYNIKQIRTNLILKKRR